MRNLTIKCMLFTVISVMFILTGISNASIKSNLGYGDPYEADIAQGDTHYYGFIKHANETYHIVLTINNDDGNSDLYGHWTYPFYYEDAIDEYTSKKSGTSTDTITVNSTSDGWFYLAVNAFKSTNYYITVCPQSYIKILDPVRLKSPGNNTSKTNSVKLEWYPVDGANSIEYRFFVSSSKATLENISNVEAECNNCMQNKKTKNTYYQLNNLSPGRYYWMVRAGCSCGGSDANSSIWSFVIESDEPKLPDLEPYGDPDRDIKKLESPCFSKQCKDDEEVIVSFTCNNSGLAAANNFKVGIKVDGSLKLSVDLDRLENYYCQSWDNWGIGRFNPGWHTMELVCDHKNDVEESNEDNNTYPKRFYIESSVKAPVITSFKINSGASKTEKRTVTLNNTVQNSPTNYMASENSNFSGASWKTYSSNPTFELSSSYGPKTVYFKVKNSAGENNDNDGINYYPLPVMSFKINNGNATTTGQVVTLNISATNNPTHYMASENSNFSGASWLTYKSTPSFTLSSGEGIKTVYVKVKNQGGESKDDDSIDYYPPPVIEFFKINGDEDKTTKQKVYLKIYSHIRPTHFIISENSNFANANWIEYEFVPPTPTLPYRYQISCYYTLSSGDGLKTIYAKLRNKGGESEKKEDTIYYYPIPVIEKFAINNNDAKTANPEVTLNITVTNNPTHYMLSENSDFSGASWISFSSNPSFTLSSGYSSKRVYVKVKNQGGESNRNDDSIDYYPLAPVIKSFYINNGDSKTADRKVTLSISATNNPTHYKVSENSNFSGASWISFNSNPSFTLSSGYSSKRVYVKVKNQGGESNRDEYSIDYYPLLPVIKSFNINNNESEIFSITATLIISSINSPTHYKASETQDFNDAEWLPYVENPEFVLSSKYGPKRVYIKLKNDGGESEEISFDDIILKQKEAPELLITPLEQELTPKGDSFTIQVKNVGTGSLNWDATLKNNPDWLSINTEFDNGIITVTCQANIGNQRTGEIVISSENAINSPQIVTVTQSEYMKTVILTVSDAEAAPGSEGMPVQISMDNISDNAPASSLQLVLKYDSNIAKINGYRTTQRTEEFTVNLDPNEDGKNSEVLILLYSMSGLSINPEKGSVLEILFDVEPTAQEDESFVLQFNECTVSNKDGNEINSDFSDTGIFLVTSPCDPCDVNCDGKINILDLQIIIKHIIERTYLKEADLNEKDGKVGDGKVNVLDLQVCLNCILDQFNNSSAKRIRSRIQLNSDQQNHELLLRASSADTEPLDSKTMNSLSLTLTEISEHNTGIIGLNLSNQDSVASGQIKIEYDSSTGFEITDAFLTDRADSFQISFSKQSISSDKAGILILFYSMTGSTIEPGFGDILKFNYSAGNNTGRVSLVFTETILSDDTGNSIPVSSQAKDIIVSDQLCLDKNQDGQINLIDVIYILQYLNGIIIK